METGATSETQVKDQIRAGQRKKMLESFGPQTRQLISELIPKNRKVSSDSRYKDEKTRRQLLRTLGSETHTTLFALASTAENPTELYNTFATLVNMSINIGMNDHGDKKIFDESENNFFERPLPKEIPASQEIKKEARDFLHSNNIYLDHADPNFLATYFYILSTNTDPQRRRSLYEAVNRTLIELFAYPIYFPAMFRSDRSFWENVDISWIYPAPQPASAKPKNHGSEMNPIKILKPKIYNPLQDMLGGGKKIAALSAENEMLKQSLTASAETTGRLQQQLDSIQRENQELRRLLQQARQQEKPANKQPRSPFNILEIPPTSTPEQIKKAQRDLVHTLHPDVVIARLKAGGASDKTIMQISNMLNERLKDINTAYEQLKSAGKVK